MYARLRFFFKELWPFFLIGFCILFAFPLKTGLKTDPAVYAAMARNALDLGSWWPLYFSDKMFTEFYEHPPFYIWAISLVFNFLGVSEWSAALLSRLSAFFSLVVLGWIFILESKESVLDSKTKSKIKLTILLTLTWVPWVKFVSSGQYEGPLSLVLVISILYYLWILKGHHLSHIQLLLGSLLGLFGFMIKGIIFFPLVFLPIAHALFKKNLKGTRFFRVEVKTSFCVLLGWLLGAIGMYFLDIQTGTRWSGTYWSRILGWGFQNSNRFDTSQGLAFSKHLGLVLDWIYLEISRSPVWTPLLWGLILYLFLVRLENIRANSLLILGGIGYLFFVFPFMISTIKMPHWAIPAYPLGAVFLVSTITKDSWFLFLEKFFHKALWRFLALGTLLFVVLFPKGLPSKYTRGEEWRFHKEELLSADAPNQRLIVSADSQVPYVVNAYAGWYLGPKYSFSLQNLRSVRSKCDGGYLWLEENEFSDQRTHIHSLGWSLVKRQIPGVKLLKCL